MNSPFDNARSKRSGVSRRELLDIAKRYGVVSTVIASSGLAGSLTASKLAMAAEEVQKKRFGSEPKITLRYGAGGYTKAIEEIQKTGIFHFINELETLTDGAIRVEYLPGGQICNQLDCVKKAQQGIIDVYTASSENSAAAAPYFNVLDFPFMFPTRGAMHYFFYHPKSEVLFRKPLRERHGIEFLYSNCELRGLYLGLKYKDAPPVDKIATLKGAKIRVTGSVMGSTALGLMGVSPVPVSWEETLDGLKSGLVDGAETSASAVAYSGMCPVVSQALELDFFANCEHVAFNSKSWDRLGSKFQEAALEAAYAAQVFSHGMNEAALTSIVGRSAVPAKGTIFEHNGVRVSFPDAQELKNIKQMCTPDSQPEAWAQWRDRLGQWAGGIDVYKEISAVAREIPEDTAVVNVVPRRWWRS